MKTINLEFYECEHQGDLDNYISDLPKGVYVTHRSINYSAETGNITIQVEDDKAFWEEFKKTDAYEFLN